MTIGISCHVGFVADKMTLEQVFSERSTFPVNYSSTTAPYFHTYDWLSTGFELDIGFIDHLQVVTTNNYNKIANLHTPNIAVTKADTKSSLR
jgi:hypothetical protein